MMSKCGSIVAVVGALLVGSVASAHEPFFMGLGDLPGGDVYSWASAVSVDGGVVVGTSSSTSQGLEGFRWENGAMIGLGHLPGGIPGSRGFGVSSDGSVVVGSSWSSLYAEAFRWTEPEGMIGLGYLDWGRPQ